MSKSKKETAQHPLWGRCCDGGLEQEGREGSTREVWEVGSWKFPLKWEAPYTRGPPASSGREGKAGHCVAAGKGWAEVVLGLEDGGGVGTHCYLASLTLVPPGPSLALCKAGSVSKDVCLFLEQRFISFHFNCLLLSWACKSAGLCYKGEPWPCEQNLAASCMTKRVLWLTGYDLRHEGMSGDDFVESGSTPYGIGNLRFSS